MEEGLGTGRNENARVEQREDEVGQTGSPTRVGGGGTGPTATVLQADDPTRGRVVQEQSGEVGRAHVPEREPGREREHRPFGR